jgi:hypothetical protein
MRPETLPAFSAMETGSALGAAMKKNPKQAHA